MLADSPRLTIIIPAFNEAPRIDDCARHFEEAVAAGSLSSHRTQLVVVDDGSTDGTPGRAEELLSPVFPRLDIISFARNAGKGAAVRAGISAAAAPAVLFMDADMSVTPKSIPALVDALESADVAIGSRSAPGSVVDQHSVQRRVMGRSFNRLVRAATELPFLDTQCGIKAFRTPAARLLFHLTRSKRFAFDVEVLVLAQQFGMITSEVPVHWQERPASSVRSLRDPLSMLHDVASLRRRDRPRTPGLVVTRRARGSEPLENDVKEVSRELRAWHPAHAIREEQLVVLLPLCDPLDVQRAAHQLKRRSPAFQVDEQWFSFAEVGELAPFDHLRPFGAATGLATQAPSLDCVASPQRPGTIHGKGAVARVQRA